MQFKFNVFARADISNYISPPISSNNERTVLTLKAFVICFAPEFHFFFRFIFIHCCAKLSQLYNTYFNSHLHRSPICRRDSVYSQSLYIGIQHGSFIIDWVCPLPDIFLNELYNTHQLLFSLYLSFSTSTECRSGVAANIHVAFCLLMVMCKRSVKIV